MTRSKVKVTRPLKLEILQFSKSISSGIFNVSWQMTTDSETMEEYLNFVWTRFSISVLVFVSRDYELETEFRLIVVYLLRKNHKNRGFRFWQLFDRSVSVEKLPKAETSIFSTDCKHRSRPSVPHGANFCSCNLSHVYKIILTFCSVRLENGR